VSRTRALDVVLEVGRRRSFASALDWPGWARSGKGVDAAVDELLGYAARYSEVVVRAGLRLPAFGDVVVVETLAGDAGTDFGAPMKAAEAERRAVSAPEARRRLSLVEAAWSFLDDVAAAAPASLRKGPRGGGRDRDAVVAHVHAAEDAYARKLAIPGKTPDVRAAIAEVLGRANDGTPLKDNGWSVRYAARRIAWHVLDHAWEIQDRSAA
jgi:hypothetical protein